ncbi:SDR family NAD(P)-dependent oxidoreductase [Leptospira sp. GIMC2001]|uniref:SDR family NAD(P)-dependent oxidoreductase n=1 Tax=Leptospira sp. GIMC2001 TaxID=1513297 RepID=UPI00234A1828|nr:SDR family NAD(P)-dependent oxidoreductase [Leptospira sp. GIMC2001]WCL47726.1 SDR family NAD(P)-dependent oxidoreductase [Leptospira sp. GIMC2001]
MRIDYWKGKTVIITGASSGIGEAIYHRLDGVVSKIYLVSRKPGKLLSNSSTSTIIPIVCDLSKQDDVEKVISKVSKLEKNSGIDVLFNNAGITAHGRFDSTEMSVFRKTFETNFFGPLRLAQGLMPLILYKKGAVVSTSTVSGLYGVPGRAAYSSSKAALHSAMEAMRIEMMKTGVRSIIVCPPYTRTNLRTSGLDSSGKRLSEEQAEGKIKTADEVALAIINSVENPNSRLVTFDKSGFAMKLLRLFSPRLLESIMYKKLYKDFSN